jgi:hypothetical protein
MSNLFVSEDKKALDTKLILRFVLIFLAYLIYAVVFGYFYSALLKHLPFVYISFLITYFSGYLILLILPYTSRFTKSVSTKAYLTHAVIFSFLVVYFQLAAYAAHVVNEGFATFGQYLEDLSILMQPHKLIQVLNLIAENSNMRIGGIDINGFTLWLIWVIEAAILMGVPIWGILQMPRLPYSQKLGVYYNHLVIKEAYKVAINIPKLLNMLKEDAVQTIFFLESGRPTHYMLVHIYYLPNEDVQYLSFEEVSIDHESKTTSEMILTHFEISTAAATEILTTKAK